MMCTYETDIHDTVLILYGHDQPILVPFDIENNPVIPDNTRVPVDGFYVVRCPPFRMLYVRKPGFHAGPRVGMILPKFS